MWTMFAARARDDDGCSAESNSKIPRLVLRDWQPKGFDTYVLTSI